MVKKSDRMRGTILPVLSLGSAAVRQRLTLGGTNMASTELGAKNAKLLEKVDAAIAEKNLLKHPFYQDWQAGKLSRAALQLYAAQYYRHVEAFP